jgi:hypothetical protein
MKKDLKEKQHVVAQFIPLLSRPRRDKGGDWASVILDKSSNGKQDLMEVR